MPRVNTNVGRTVVSQRSGEKAKHETATFDDQDYKAVEEGGGHNHAQRIVRELYVRYDRQLQRWKDYRNLVAFLAFVGLFLATLFLQRQAVDAYKVYNTIATTVLPDGGETQVMQEKGQVYDWLQGLLENVWKDPVCGDGLCEAPFEYASYSRFGCKADCGRLQEVQNLTTVQVDVYFDFAHPIGSIPAADLMTQASWNLCPVESKFSANCYFADDITFERLSGSQTYIIEDMPDGQWDLMLRRDTFNKLRGAVRDWAKLQTVGLYYKVAVAALAAEVEADYEIGLLQQAVDLSAVPLRYYVLDQLAAGGGDWPKEAAEEELEQMLTGACACTPLADPDLVQAIFNNTVHPSDNATLYPDSGDLWEFCTGGAEPSDPAAYTVNDIVYWMEATGVTNGDVVQVPGREPVINRTAYPEAEYAFELKWDVNETVTVDDAWCGASTWALASGGGYTGGILGKLWAWRVKQTVAVQRLAIDLRLGDGRSTGKAAQSLKLRNTLRTWLNEPSRRMAELVTPIYVTPRGNAPLANQVDARLDALAVAYTAGATFAVDIQPALLNISRKFVYPCGMSCPQGNVSLPDVGTRALARIAEVQAIVAEVRTLNATDPNGAVVTVGDVLAAFRGAGATTPACPTSPVDPACGPTLPTPAELRAYLSANAALLPGLPDSLEYDIVTWDGSTTAYLTFNLDVRAPEYIGTCEADTYENTFTNDEWAPWNCSRWDPTDTSIVDYLQGDWNMTQAEYRANCEMPADFRLDCQRICYCGAAGCGQQEHCHCDACDVLNANAAEDQQFISIAAVAEQNGEDVSYLGISGGSAGGGSGRRRRLQALQRLATKPNPYRRFGRRLQTTNEDLANMLTDLATLTKSLNNTVANNLQSQIVALQAQVDAVMSLATQRANDKTLVTIMNEAKAQITTGNADINAKLDRIIGEQLKALELAQKTEKQLAALNSLQEKQLAALGALERAVNNSVLAIKTALQSKIITPTQALMLWKRARRDRAASIKQSLLANLPTNLYPKEGHAFKLDNDNVYDDTTTRERRLGTTNRVIAGLMIHTHRTDPKLCPRSKFSRIQPLCTGPTSLSSYGIDPVFKRGTTLYEPDFDDISGELVVRYYNCSELAAPTYNVNNALLGRVDYECDTSNPDYGPCYCAELYNPQYVPFAFHHFPLQGKSPGFPVWFDINLSEEDAASWFDYVKEGLLLDTNTRSVEADLITYNAQLRMFGYTHVTFSFTDGGSIKVTYGIYTLRVELYSEPEDYVRMVMELVVAGLIALLVLLHAYHIVHTKRTTGSLLRYFTKGWHIIELASDGLFVACAIIWLNVVFKHANTFDIALRYDVYETLQPRANYLALKDDGAGMAAAWAAFKRLDSLIDLVNYYYALNGINILLLIARVLKLMDFQPRLGVVTRSLWLAGPDLIHFALVAGMVFVGYSMMAHLIFGNAIQQFASFGDSINTCFEILLGNIDVNTQLRQLGGLQSIAGTLFFWSYELLVFMVLLNFLLAIIVDAFAEIKETTSETVGVPAEVLQILRDKARGVVGAFRKDYISDAKLRDLLRTWAGEAEHGGSHGGSGGKDGDGKDGGGDAAAAAAAADKKLKVLNEDLDEATLREILQACLEDIRGDDVNTKKQAAAAAAAAASGRSGGGWFAPRRQLRATPDDVNLAAHYIVDRFGVAPDPEEEEEGEQSALDKERDQLAQALERLADVQRELAEGQRSLMSGQRQLAEQQARLVGLMNDS